MVTKQSMEPIYIAGKEIRPETVILDEVSNIFPHTSDKGKQTWIVETLSDKEYELQSLNRNPKYVLVVDNIPRATVSDRYRPITNYELLYATKNIMEEKKININGLKKWGWMNKTQYFIETDMIEINGDEHKFGYMISNSYDLTATINIGTYLFRMVCENGMMAWSNTRRTRRKHTSGKYDYTTFVSELEELIETNIMSKNDIVATLENAKNESANEKWLTPVCKRLNMRKWELDTITNISSDYPITKVEPQKPEYSKWDFMIDVTAVARISRNGENERKVNLNRANYLESGIYEHLIR